MIEFINLNDLNLKGVSSNYIFSDVMVGFQKVNVFFGKNNSGKSRLLRTFFMYQNIINERNLRVSAYLKSKVTFSKDISVHFKAIYSRINVTSLETNKSNQVALNIQSLSLSGFNTETKELINEFKYKIAEAKYAKQLNCEYIPILRGLQPLLPTEQNNQTKFKYESIYESRIRHIYEINKEFKIHSGESIFEKIKELLLGDEKQRELIYKFEKFISENIFDGENITLIPKYGDDILNIKRGKEDQRSITELGDGLQSVIMILFPMFTSTQKTIFLIEEPEVHMHPEMQRKLAELIVKLCNEDKYEFIDQVFISTHSAHFINIEKAAKFSFTREDNNTVVSLLSSTQELSKSLNLLGYLPSDLLQANYIIWVEGPSDKIYINKLIKQKAHELKEYKHYTIMFYAGSTAKHLTNISENADNLIFSLNRNCAYLRDSDITSIGTRSKYEEEKDRLKTNGVLCWLTEKRELENHIDKQQFLEAVRSFKNDDSLEYFTNEDDGIRDRFLFKKNAADKSSHMHKRIELTTELFNEIGKNGYDVNKINARLLKKELSKSIIVNRTSVIISDKVGIANLIINNNPIKIDDNFEGFLIDLIKEIKSVNHINP